MPFRNVRVFALGLLLAACGDDNPLLSTSTIDFGQTDCGTTQVPRTLLIANPEGDAFTFEAAFTTGTHYMVQPASGFVLPGQQLELTIFSAPIPAVSATTENLYGDTLTITTSRDGDKPHEIAIQQTARGSVLELSSTNVTIAGTHSVSAPGTANLTVRNTGNAPATDVTVVTSGGFTFAPGVIASIAGGAEAAGTITYRATTVGAETSSIALTSKGVSCSAPVTNASVSATGTFAGVAPTKLVNVPSVKFRNGPPTVFAILPGGYVASFGNNDRGARGAGSTVPSNSHFSLVRGADDHPLDGVVDVTGNRSGACALRADKSVYCWGNTTLARGRDITVPEPFARPFASDADAVGVGYGVRCIAGATEGALTCTSNLTNGNTVGWDAPSAKHLTVFPGGGFATQADGTVISFGSNESGQRGTEVETNSPPSEVEGLTNVVEVAAMVGRANNREKRSGCARTSEGTVWCWGWGNRGRLGNGATENVTTPTQVMIDGTTPLTGVTAIASGHGHTCATTATTVYCWGVGKHRRLGRDTGETNAYAQPIETAIEGATGIVGFQRGTCVLMPNGRITCFGETPFSFGPQASFDEFVAATP